MHRWSKMDTQDIFCGDPYGRLIVDRYWNVWVEPLDFKGKVGLTECVIGQHGMSDERTWFDQKVGTVASQLCVHSTYWACKLTTWIYAGKLEFHTADPWLSIQTRTEVRVFNILLFQLFVVVPMKCESSWGSPSSTFLMHAPSTTREWYWQNVLFMQAMCWFSEMWISERAECPLALVVERPENGRDRRLNEGIWCRWCWTNRRE